MIGLTLILLGLQVVWTIEMAIGTPYLKTFQLPHSWIMIVWLCGPLSGLAMQPLIGVLSDKHQSRWGRRRPFIVVGVIFVIISLLLIAYVRELSAVILLMLSPEQTSPSVLLQQTPADGVLQIGGVIFGFFMLDFSINVVQAAARALILDVLTAEQQERGNSWASIMISSGNIVGYLLGSLELMGDSHDSHVKSLTKVAVFLLAFSACVTCYCVKEVPLLTRADSLSTSTDHNESLYDHAVIFIYTAQRLPRQLKLLCLVQVFVWIGWFQFNFFSTELVKEMYVRGQDSLADQSYAIRLGARALLLMSTLSTACALILPLIVRNYQLSIRRIWTYSIYFLGVLMMSTVPVYFLDTYLDGIIDSAQVMSLLIALAGFPVSAALWIPFSIIGEYVNMPNDKDEDYDSDDIELSRSNSRKSRSPTKSQTTSSSVKSIKSPSAGTVLGIHNVAIVLPQIASSLVSFVIFQVLQREHQDEDDPWSVAVVWFVGGLSVLVGGILSRNL